MLSLFITLIANTCFVFLCWTFHTEAKVPLPIYLSSKDSKSFLHNSFSKPSATLGGNIKYLFLTLFKIGIFLAINKILNFLHCPIINEGLILITGGLCVGIFSKLKSNIID